MDDKPLQDIKPVKPIAKTPVEPTTAGTQQPALTDQPEVTTESQDTGEPTEPETKKEGIKGVLSTIAILVIAPLIALCLTAFVFQSYEVDGPSMETTLQNQDRLIVYKLPRTIARITKHAYVPKRAEIIIFSRQDVLEFGTPKPRQLIKRVIALPGERVVVKDGKLTVYNNEKPQGFQPDEIAPYGKVIGETQGDIDLTVPQDSVFVCGDNRRQSLDSRSFGPVPLKDIVGRLSLRVYPFNKGEVF
jgi:signal peptidase I